jgi:type IV secretory pathway VirB10-like protein
MSRRLARATVLAVLLFAAASRADDVYVWSDGAGETHYTNDIASIPEKYKRTVRKLEGPPEAVAPRSAIPGVELEKPAPKEPEPPPKQAATPDQPPPPQPIEEAIRAPRDDEKVSEEQWRDMFRKANERVRRAERKTQRTREALAKMPGQDLTSYDYAGNIVVDSRYQSLKVQLEEDEYQLGAAREELHDLERAAARDAVPLEWRR